MMVLAMVTSLTLGWCFWSKPINAEIVLPVAAAKNLVEVNGQNFEYAIWKNNPSTNINLVANFTQQASMVDIVLKNNCVAAINGGFYDTKNQPLGWLVENKQTLKKPIKSSLFNGFVYQTGKVFGIKRTVPAALASWGIQTGPIVWESGKPLQLKLTSDKFARRIVLAVNNNALVIWMAIYGQNSVFDGPRLANLPKIVALINDQEQLQLDTAVNLDGGSASAFYSPEKKLYEFSSVGSVLCARQM